MRPISSLAESVNKAQERGFTVIAAPMVELRAIKSPEFERLVSSPTPNAWDYVVFTSANGVSHAFGYAEEMADTASLQRMLSQSHVVAIGPKTKQALERAGVKVSRVPERYSSAGLITLFSKLRPTGKSIAIIRSAHGSSVLVPGLARLGAKVVELPIYEMTMPTDRSKAEQLVKRASEGGVDVFCFTSSMTVKNFLAIAESMGLKEKVLSQMKRSRVAALGSPTALTLKSNGIVANIIPGEETFESLLEEIARQTSSPNSGSLEFPQ
jgi:uroporphyrinogen-III synthase